MLAYGHQHADLYLYSDNIRILDAAAAAGLLQLEQTQALQQAYQQLRGVSHRQTLDPATEAVQQLDGAMEQVRKVWEQLFS